MSSYSSDDVLAALKKAGFTAVSRRGSHLKLRAIRDGSVRTVILPHPKRDLPVGTFGAVLRQAGLSRVEFDQLV